MFGPLSDYAALFRHDFDGLFLAFSLLMVLFLAGMGQTVLDILVGNIKFDLLEFADEIFAIQAFSSQ